MIKIIENFISDAECDTLIEYMNNKFETDRDLFMLSGDKRISLQFGRDGMYTETSYPDLDNIYDIEPLIRGYFYKITNRISKEYNDNDHLFVNSMWFSKQFAGGMVDPHEDTDSGNNQQFRYSAVLYLNTLENSGALKFLDIGVEIQPEKGTLIIFESKAGGWHSVDPVDQDRYSMPFWVTPDVAFAL